MLKFRCTLCGDCCKRYVPLVTATDVKRLQQNTQLPLTELLVFYGTGDFASPMDEDDERLFDTKAGKFALGLARRDGACVFLENNLCTAHKFKPGVCRAFPFTPSDTRDLRKPFVLANDPCHGNNAYDEFVNQAQVRRDYKAFDDDYSEYVELVKQWNESPKSRQADIHHFLKFVGLT